MADKCIFYTYAYNAEKTIGRTIESVLAQTYTNWVYYVLDNGATDSTGEIIKKYAEEEPRIKMLVNKQNMIYEKGNTSMEIIKNYDGNDCFCSLDADDEYTPTFLEDMLAFVKKHDLDISACGHDSIIETSGEVGASRVLSQDIILDSPESFDINFPMYHAFLRTRWGKLIKISVLRKFDISRHTFTHYAGDTSIMVENFRNASRVGILAKSLHRYYISPKSSSYKLDDTRISSDWKIDDVTRAFLVDKCGRVSPRNNSFLKSVYFHAIIDTTLVVFNADISDSEKIFHLHTIFMHEKSLELLGTTDCWVGYIDRLQVFLSIVDFVQKQKEVYRKERGKNYLMLMELEVILNNIQANHISMKEMLANAVNLYQSGDYSGSAELFLELEKDPVLSGIAHYFLASVSNIANDPVTAKNLYYSAFEKHPNICSFVLPENHANKSYIYRYKRNEETVKKCCLCGVEGKACWCYNLLESNSLHVRAYNPVRLWMYCENCHHMYAEEFPESAFDLSQFAAGEGMPTTPQFFHYNSKLLSVLSSFTSGKDLLEIGVGGCECALVAQERGYNVTALDISVGNVRQAKQYGINAILCDFVTFESSQQWDIIIMGDVIERVSDPVAAVQKVCKLLRSDGVLWISTPNFDSAFSKYAGHADPMRREAGHKNYFSRRSMYGLLERFGFTIADYQISARYKGSMEIIAVRKP